MPELTIRTKHFRQTIKAFIDKRCEEKLDGKDNPAMAAKYEYDTWLASAAKRVGQIQAVTHVLKGSHPDARGSSLYVLPEELPDFREVGSHLLGNAIKEDVVGNAAALDVYKLLKEEVEDQSLLYWAQTKDADLEAALADDAAIAHERLEVFAGLIHNDESPMSHSLAKQLYWLVDENPTDNSHFHLLQPLFPSSLVQTLHEDIEVMRFGETNKIARQARKNNEACGEVYHNYLNLAMRKLGGTKPQNISQLNSERRGINYLLPSLPPPAWKTNRQPKVLGVDTILASFRWFYDGGMSVSDRIKALADFLKADPDNTFDTRETRKTMEQELGQQLALFGATIRYQRTPGWTRDADCRLPLCEQLWLDPERVELPVRADSPEFAEEDEAFKQAFAWGGWPDQVADRFAAWLNGQLHKSGLKTVGDTEHKHWARQAIIEADWPAPLQRRATVSEGGAA